MSVTELGPVIRTELQRLRLDACLSPEQLYERTGVAPLTIRRIEKGGLSRTPNASTLARLSTFFAAPASSLQGPPRWPDEDSRRAA